MLLMILLFYTPICSVFHLLNNSTDKYIFIFDNTGILILIFGTRYIFNNTKYWIIFVPNTVCSVFTVIMVF